MIINTLDYLKIYIIEIQEQGDCISISKYNILSLYVATSWAGHPKAQAHSTVVWEAGMQFKWHQWVTPN